MVCFEKIDESSGPAEDNSPPVPAGTYAHTERTGIPKEDSEGSSQIVQKIETRESKKRKPNKPKLRTAEFKARARHKLRQTLAIRDIKKYCVSEGILDDEGLRLVNEDYWYVLCVNGWSRNTFWEAVLILLNLKQLPEEYSRKDGNLLLLSSQELDMLESTLPSKISKS